MGTTIDRIAPTLRPEGRPDGWQRWRELLFVHWEVDPAAVRALVPEGLELDLWEGRALVGVVPFRMRGVRPWWLPRPFAQSFLELNVRLYVTHEGRPGVYFLSLDAASWTAVKAARAGWSLPYFHARMAVERAGDRVRYSSERIGGGASLRADYRVGRALGPSEPGSLQFFLLERYLLFVEREGRIRCGQVAHTPYRAFDATLLSLEQTVVSAAGLTHGEAPFSVHFSPGVDVEVFGFRP